MPTAAPPTVTPRLAATTLILRDSSDGPQVLMVRRSMQASFMPGAYVFPGGAVAAADGSPAAAARVDEPLDRLAQRVGRVLQVGDQGLAFAVAGLRECFEECGLWLGAPDHHQPQAQWDALRARLHAGASLADLAQEAGLPLATRCLQPWSHWVTPLGVPKRFDTVFFVCRAPAGQLPTVDQGETTTLCWVHPPTALAEHARKAFQMEFATVSTVRSLEPFAQGSVQALLDHAASLASLPPLHPRLKLDAEGRIRGVLMPGEAGYAEAAGDG